MTGSGSPEDGVGGVDPRSRSARKGAEALHGKDDADAIVIIAFAEADRVCTAITLGESCDILGSHHGKGDRGGGERRIGGSNRRGGSG